MRHNPQDGDGNLMAGGTVYGPIGYIHIDPKIHLPQIVIFSDQLIDELGITADAVLRCIPLNGEPVLKTIGGFHERFHSTGLHQPSTGLRLVEQKSPLLAELAGLADIDFPENPTDADYEEFKHIYSKEFPTACEELMLVTHTQRLSKSSLTNFVNGETKETARQNLKTMKISEIFCYICQLPSIIISCYDEGTESTPRLGLSLIGDGRFRRPLCVQVS